MLERRAGGRCEICRAGPDPTLRRRMEAHERFAYDDATDTQVLTRLLWICSDCHQVTHLGLAALRGQRAAALAHLRAVTGMDPAAAEAHVAAAFELWRTRSHRHWRLDLTMLERAGITITPPPDPATRAAIAEAHLSRRHAADAAGGPAATGWDDDEVEDDADELNAYFAAHGLGGDSDTGEEGGVSVRAVSAADAPAYLEALLHGRDPFPPATPPHASPTDATDDGGRGAAAPRRRWWSRRR